MPRSLAFSTSRPCSAIQSTMTRLRTGKDAHANLSPRQPLQQPAARGFPRLFVSSLTASRASAGIRLLTANRVPELGDLAVKAWTHSAKSVRFDLVYDLPTFSATVVFLCNRSVFRQYHRVSSVPQGVFWVTFRVIALIGFLYKP